MGGRAQVGELYIIMTKMFVLGYIRIYGLNFECKNFSGIYVSSSPLTGYLYTAICAQLRDILSLRLLLNIPFFPLAPVFVTRRRLTRANLNIKSARDHNTIYDM